MWMEEFVRPHAHLFYRGLNFSLPLNALLHVSLCVLPHEQLQEEFRGGEFTSRRKQMPNHLTVINTLPKTWLGSIFKSGFFIVHEAYIL